MKRSLKLSVYIGFGLSCVIMASCSLLPARSSATLEEGPATPESIGQAEGRGPASKVPVPGAAGGVQPEMNAEAHFSLAQAYSSEGKVDQAIEEYKVVLMYDPHSALVHVRLATEYVKKGLLSEALDASRRAVEIDPQFVDARLILAGLYSATHDADAALREYERILAADPKHDEAAVYKAQLLLEEGRGRQALASIREFVKGSPDSPLANYYRGRIAQQTEEFDEAVQAYRKALEIRPGFVQAGLALGFLFEEKGKTKEAIQTYESLFQDAQDVTAATRLATIYLKAEKYEMALPYLESVHALDPEDMNSQVKLGLVQMELKKFPQAIETFEQILKVNPEADRVRYYLGSIYENQGQAAQAVEQFSRVAPDSKLFSDAALHVAMQLKNQGKLSEARDFMRGALEKAPQIPSLYVFSASLEEEAKDFISARRVLEAAVQRFPEDEKSRYYLGTILDRLGEADDAMAQMENLLRINPNNVDALNYIGYAWTARKVRLGDAGRVLKRALDLKPENGYVQDSWGWYLFVSGRVKEAVVALEQAVRLKPEEAIILEHLGDVYASANLREKAFRQYETALKHADDETHKAKLQAKLENIKKELKDR